MLKRFLVFFEAGDGFLYMSRNMLQLNLTACKSICGKRYICREQLG